MYPADAAGGKDADPGKSRADHGGGHRGRPGPPGGKAGSKVGARQLGHGLRLTQAIKLRVGQADVDLPVHDRDGGGCRAMGAHLGLHPTCCFHILRERHAVGDDRAFQRNDGRALGMGLGHFR